MLEEAVASQIGWSIAGIDVLEIQLDPPSNKQQADELDSLGKCCHTLGASDISLRLLSMSKDSWINSAKCYALSTEDSVEITKQLPGILDSFDGNIGVNYPILFLKHLNIPCKIDGEFIGFAFNLLAAP